MMEPKLKMFEGKCDHLDFIPTGSAVLMTTMTAVSEDFVPKLESVGIVNIILPRTHFAYCPVCNTRLTGDCLTEEEVRRRVRTQWDDCV